MELDLQGGAQETASILNFDLIQLLVLLPNDDSSDNSKEFIDEESENGGPIYRRVATIFEIGLDTVFTDEIASEIQPSG